MCRACRCVCMGICMPSGQSEEYHIVTVQSDQARVGFSSSGSTFGALGVRPWRAGGRAGGWVGRRTSGEAAQHESTRMTSTGTSMHLQGYGRSGSGRSGSGQDRSRARSAAGLDWCVRGRCTRAGSSHVFVSSSRSELLRDCEASLERVACLACVASGSKAGRG